jgi:2,4-dienoyl-CoA reductase-like NADH-dependent reductase (Old Yellow Enzyme family)
MSRDGHRIFSPATVAPLSLPNRLVRAATWDPSMLPDRSIKAEVLDLYRTLAAGGAGCLITGDFSAVPDRGLDRGDARSWRYDDMRIVGFDHLARAVHETAPACRVLSQVSAVVPGAAPSVIPAA